MEREYSLFVLCFNLLIKSIVRILQFSNFSFWFLFFLYLERPLSLYNKQRMGQCSKRMQKQPQRPPLSRQPTLSGWSIMLCHWSPMHSRHVRAHLISERESHDHGAFGHSDVESQRQSHWCGGRAQLVLLRGNTRRCQHLFWKMVSLQTIRRMPRQ